MKNLKITKNSRKIGLFMSVVFAIAGGALFANLAKNPEIARAAADPIGTVHLLPADAGIVFDGTQYVDSGVRADMNQLWKFDFQISQNIQWQNLDEMFGFGANNMLTNGQPQFLSYENMSGVDFGNYNSYIAGNIPGTPSTQIYFDETSPDTTYLRNAVWLTKSGDPDFYSFFLNDTAGSKGDLRYKKFAPGGNIFLGSESNASGDDTVAENNVPWPVDPDDPPQYQGKFMRFEGNVFGFSVADPATDADLLNYQPAVQCGANNTLIYGFRDSVSGKFFTPTAGNPFAATISQTYAEVCGTPDPEIPSPTSPIVPTAPSTGFREK